MKTDRNEELTVSEIIERQRQLEVSARRKFPWDPKECTLYMDIPPRQLLFACLTCKPTNAICYACGLRCHAHHHIVELYSKRGFKCDCGTSHNTQVQCSLRHTEDDDWANSHMHYQHNFEGKFCICEESVDDESYGDGAMFQCLLGTQCGEDWFHARCIVGISREEELARQENAGEVQETSSMETDESGDVLDTTYPELPSEFGALICPRCAGDAPQLIQSEAVLSELNGYLFLKENFGEIISQHPQLSSLLVEYPFLCGNEPSYLPDKDEDDTTLLEAGEQALQELPRAAVIDGLAKFNQLQTNLVGYLRQIGSDGHAVTKEEIEAFFSQQK